MITCRTTRSRTAFSLVGLLVTFVLVIVLFTIGMTALNKSMTGEGSAVDGTVYSFQDKFTLYALGQAMAVHAADHDGRFVTPSMLTERPADDTTAALFSRMVMAEYTPPEQLIAANEFSGYVEIDEDYDYRAYDPASRVYWDPAFMANLHQLSNTSFAHVPLYGTRFDRHWQPYGSGGFPILGNRGPKDGIDDPMSYTYGRNGVWGGHLMFGDGHVEFIDTFTLPTLSVERDGEVFADNVFAVEDGPAGADAIISFTKTMTGEGAVLDFD